MADRVRIRNRQRHGGNYFYDGVAYPLGNRHDMTEAVRDVPPLPFGDNYIFLMESRESGNGHYSRQWNLHGEKIVDGIVDVLNGTDPFWYGHEDLPYVPSSSELATELLYKTNPSKPDVDVPVDILEFLTQGPTKMFHGGKALINRIGSAQMRAQFSTAPLISDVATMVDAQRLIAKRFKRLKRQYGPGTTKSNTLDLRTDSAWKEYPGQFVNYGPYIWTPEIKRVTNRRVWGSVKWTHPGAFPYSDEDLERLARRAVEGLTLDFSTAWELMPWSWMIDWCTNVGNYVASTRNVVGLNPDAPAIMTQVNSTLTFSGYSSTDGSGTYSSQGGYTKTVNKERRPASPSLNAHIPALTADHVSVLMGIGFQKYKKDGPLSLTDMLGSGRGANSFPGIRHG